MKTIAASSRRTGEELGANKSAAGGWEQGTTVKKTAAPSNSSVSFLLDKTVTNRRVNEGQTLVICHVDKQEGGQNMSVQVV